MFHLLINVPPRHDIAVSKQHITSTIIQLKHFPLTDAIVCESVELIDCRINITFGNNIICTPLTQKNTKRKSARSAPNTKGKRKTFFVYIYFPMGISFLLLNTGNWN